MSTATRLPPVLLVAVVLHTAVFPQLRVFGVAADVLLLVAIAAGREGPTVVRRSGSAPVYWPTAFCRRRSGSRP